MPERCVNGEILSVPKKKKKESKGALEGALRPLVKTTQTIPSICVCACQASLQG